MKDHVSYWLLLYKLHVEENDWNQAVKDLTNARELQLRILGKLTRNSDILRLQSEKKMAARWLTLSLNKQNVFSVCCDLAEMHSNQRDWNKAIELYKEAISLSDKDIKVKNSLFHPQKSNQKIHLNWRVCSNLPQSKWNWETCNNATCNVRPSCSSIQQTATQRW